MGTAGRELGWWNGSSQEVGLEGKYHLDTGRESHRGSKDEAVVGDTMTALGSQAWGD